MKGNDADSVSAFIPFCLYQSKEIVSGQQLTHRNLSSSTCTSFKPTFLEGQLCYKLDLKQASGQGKRNELMLLLDYNTELSLQRHDNSSVIDSGDLYLDTLDNEQYEAKIHINTLSWMMNFGGGTYKMTAVKRMTARPDFLKMPLKDRDCNVEEYEDCRTRKLLKKCDCIPWKVPGYQEKSHHSFS